MRSWASAIGLLVVLVAADVHSAQHAFTLELVDDEPIGVRVTTSPIYFGSGTCPATGTLLFAGTLSKGKPIAIGSDEHGVCIEQTFAPFLTNGWTAPRFFFHTLGKPPVLVRFRSRPPAIGVTPSAVFQGPPSPLTVVVEGKQRIGLAVAEGTTAPCDAIGNKQLFRGAVEPGSFTLSTSAICICWQKTTSPFVAAGWSPGTIQCRPKKCASKWCPMDLDGPFTLRLQPG